MEHLKKHDLLIISSSYDVRAFGSKCESFMYASLFILCLYCGTYVRESAQLWDCEHVTETATPIVKMARYCREPG